MDLLSSLATCLFHIVILLQLAKLSRADMKAVKNMKLLEGSDSKKTSHGGFSLKFDSAKVNKYFHHN